MKKRYLFLLLATAGVLLLPFLPEPASGGARWSNFLGRFHILLLHFPVVLVLGLVGLECWRWRQPTVLWDGLLPVLWGITLLSCFFTVLAGYLLYLSGEYQGALVRQHMWMGVLLTVALAVSALLRFAWQNRVIGRFRLLFPGLLLTSGGLAVLTGHLGGSLTHGPAFLTEYLLSLKKEKPAPIEQKQPAELLVFQDLIMPVLKDKCQSCHNEHKSKGDLLMTSFAALAQGGKSGKPMLVAGNPEQSELYHRITLPADDDDHMPPPEKSPLDSDEIALIRWWIAEGASAEQVLGNGPDDMAGKALIQRYLPKLFQAERLKIRQKSESEALAGELAGLGDKLGLVIEPDPATEGFFAVSLPIPPSTINDQTITRLLPYADLFSRVSLPGTAITDEALFDLSKMTHLRQLYLPKTCIKGEGLVYLQSLGALEELNLSYSYLTDAGALQLLKLPGLEKVYVFGTAVAPPVLDALRRNLLEVQILEQEGPYY